METIQLSIDRLPSCITKLDLCTYGSKPVIFQEKERQLSFKNLPQLEELEIFDDNSTLSLKKRRVLSNSINGPLTNTFRSLDIRLDSVNGANIFRNYVLPLDNLTELKINIGTYGSPVIADDDAGAFGLCVRSSSICNSLESLDLSIHYGRELSTFWQSFVSPLQNLSELTLTLFEGVLNVNEWPHQLNFLTLNIDGEERFYGCGEVPDDPELFGRVELHGISRSSLKCIRLWGLGNIMVKDDPDGKDQTIIIIPNFYDEYDDSHFIRNYYDNKFGFPEVIEEIDNVKFMIEGEWTFYKS
ncbi:unnamed protein product [Ambrosiozyma monospora]|uniref:Unnamed protein product n=1 Tax=Ambrosiozyma monospora TaxID=43982 RepID=A0ACB5SXY2_AMBMO|nr:unnamed protein product [Ambrosiozyma monospora]